MKQKKNRLSFSTETVRALSRSLADDQLQQAVGGFSQPTIVVSKCAYSTGDTCQQ
jgi:hypothetical protein